MRTTTLTRAVLTALVLVIALAGAGAAQITSVPVRDFKVMKFSSTNVSGTPTYSRALIADPDSAGQMNATATVVAVLDSLRAVLEVNGIYRNIQINNRRDTVQTNYEYWLPSSVSRVFSIGFTRTRPLVVGEQFRVEIVTAASGAIAQFLSNADSIANAGTDTVAFDAISGPGGTVDFLISASSAASDSTVFRFGYQVLNGLTWAGDVNQRVIILADSVHVPAGGHSARVTLTDVPAGVIRPVVTGRANTCKRKVIVSRIKAIWRD